MAKFLIVDDSSLCRVMMTEWLRDAGHTSVAIESPALLGSTLARERPDVVVMDVDLQGVRGDRMVNAAREGGLLRGCPVVLSSARRDSDLAMLCVECGAIGYVQKGGDGKAFVRALEAYLPRRSLTPSRKFSRA